MKAANLGLAFLLELALLAALAYWSFHLGASTGVCLAVAASATIGLALLWSLIAAPNAKRRLDTIPLVAFKVVVFTVGAALLFRAGQHGLAAALEVLALANLGLAIAWGQV